MLQEDGKEHESSEDGVLLYFSVQKSVPSEAGQVGGFQGL